MNCYFGYSGAVSASKSKASAVTDRRYSGDRHERKESDRFKSFTYEELIKRDKHSIADRTCPASLDGPKVSVPPAVKLAPCQR